MRPQMDRPSEELLRQSRDGSESAAAEIFDRYAARLTRLARSRIAAKLARRIDPEDVVLSAYRSFFVAARQDRFALERSGDLWRLLVRITLHKLYRSAAHHAAGRRSVDREIAGGDDAVLLLRDREPTPDEAVALADELDGVMRSISERKRRVLEMRLQGYALRDIAEELGVTQRQVTRMLGEIRRQMRRTAGLSAPLDLPDNEESTPLGRRRNGRIDPLLRKFFRRHRELRFGDYLLQQHLGAGATGKVYRAVANPTGETVAVKFLRKAVLATESVVVRFLREAETVMGLRHPGIVGVRGFGRTPNGGFFIVADWIDGPDLAVHASQTTVDQRDAAAWLAQAAEAVHHAHEHGIIHCDLKPANLLLGSDGCIRVTDFGFARRLDEPDDDAGIAGTLGFMAPEQVDAGWGRIGPWTDVYGLGATLFALLCGRSPIAGRRAADLLAQVVSGTPIPSVRSICPTVSPRIDTLIARCLAKQSADRFASASEVRDALGEFGAPYRQPPSSPSA